MLETYGIEVPFPEVMTQQDYDDLYYRQLLSEHFKMELYEKCCKILDDAVDELITGKKEEVYIEHKDIYTCMDINYGDVKKSMLEAIGYELICTNDEINHRFVLRGRWMNNG